jgi:hypothetical protein
MAGAGTTIQKSQLVEIAVSVANADQSTKYSFPDQPQLRTEARGIGVFIDGIEVFNVNDVSNAPISGNAIISAAIMQRSFLTLFVSTPGQNSNKGEYINFMPLTTLHRIQSNQTGTASPYVRDLIKLPGLTVDWSKSYVTIPVKIGVIANPVSFLFNIYYHFGPQT